MLNQHQTIKDNIAKFNKPNPLVDYLVKLIGDKKYVEIADIGSGPYSIIGDHLKGVDVKLYLMDNQDFNSFWKKYNTKPFYYIERADMEDIPYANDWFDIVHSANALDHTKNALKAVEEMIRVCKTGGYVYIECSLDQMDTGHKHFWNAKEDGCFVSHDSTFNLTDLGFSVDYIPNELEKRYHKIVAILKK